MSANVRAKQFILYLHLLFLLFLFLLFLLLLQVIPMLEKGLDSPETQERQGVCIGLSEIIQQTSRDNVLLYVDSLLPTIRNALCDKEPDVRAAAAQTFDSLHSTVGEYAELSLYIAVYLSILLYNTIITYSSFICPSLQVLVFLMRCSPLCCWTSPGRTAVRLPWTASSRSWQ